MYAWEDLIRHEGADEEQQNPLVDVRLRGEVVWIASRVDIVRILVHPHIVDRHDRRERQVSEIDSFEAGRNSQVDDHIL